MALPIGPVKGEPQQDHGGGQKQPTVFGKPQRQGKAAAQA